MEETSQKVGRSKGFYIHLHIYVTLVVTKVSSLYHWHLEIEKSMEHLMFSLAWQFGYFHPIIHISDFFLSPKSIALSHLGFLLIPQVHLAQSHFRAFIHALPCAQPYSRSLNGWLWGNVYMLAQIASP